MVPDFPLFQLLLQTCIETPIADNPLDVGIWTPVEFQDEQVFWRDTSLITLAIFAMFISAAYAFFSWSQLKNPSFILRILGFQLTLLSVLAVFVYRVYQKPIISFGSYSPEFFFGLGVITFYVVLAASFVIIAAISSKLLKNRYLQGGVLATNVGTAAIVLIGWVMFVYAQDFC